MRKAVVKVEEVETNGFGANGVGKEEGSGVTTEEDLPKMRSFETR